MADDNVDHNKNNKKRRKKNPAPGLSFHGLMPQEIPA